MASYVVEDRIGERDRVRAATLRSDRAIDQRSVAGGSLEGNVRQRDLEVGSLRGSAHLSMTAASAGRQR